MLTSTDMELEPDELLPRAEAVGDQIMKVEIPSGKLPGDTFIVTTPDGQQFSVSVPDDATPGSYIDIIVPEVVQEATKSTVTMQKSTVGAVLTAGAVGLVLGPVGAVVLAGGALAAVTSKGKVGETSRKWGEQAYNGCANAKNWTFSKASQASSSVQQAIENRRKGSPGASAVDARGDVSYEEVKSGARAI